MAPSMSHVTELHTHRTLVFGKVTTRTSVLLGCAFAAIAAIIGFTAIVECRPPNPPNPPSSTQPAEIIAPGIDQFCQHQASFSQLKIAQRPFLVYVGTSGLTQPGFVSYDYLELDITKPGDFQQLMCPGSIDIFFSEHTLEHIPIDKYGILFSLFIKYLKPGGFVRLAIPTFYERHVPSDVDKAHGHVAFASARALEAEMASAGYVNVTILEQLNFANGRLTGFTSKKADECEGRVRRSLRHDPRNIPYLKARYASYELVGNNDIADVVNSTEIPRVLSTIIQGHRPW